MNDSPNTPYSNNVTALVFEVSGALFGVDAHDLQEILWLPELTLVEEAPYFQVGLFDLHGQVVNVIDLNLRFGHPMRAPTAHDYVVVLRHEGALIGVIAHQVFDLRELQVLHDPERAAVATGDGLDVGHRMVYGEAHFDDRIVMMLRAGQLIPHSPLPLEGLVERPDHIAGVSAADLRTFAERAQSYQQRHSETQAVQTQDIVVVSMGNERFGMLLTDIVEFAMLGHVFPIPSCPPHVLGNMNLRGDIVTVFDIAHLLGLPSARGQTGGALVIYERDQLFLGIWVDAVHDVLQIENNAIRSVPIGIPDERKAHLIGEVNIGDQAVVLIDMNHIFDSEVLVVDQSARPQSAALA